MCSEIAIEVSGVSKCYHIYDKPSHRLFQMILPRRNVFYREFWALSNINFNVMAGEAVGIIGRNGSGKSTLLQIICGTLSSTIGDVTLHGRVAALLELGAGFNPEFTGRENIYVNGALLGMSRSEIDGVFAEIVEFADIGQYLDQPVKTYSSGMFVRLAFSVSIHSAPSVLVIDEALAVGDVFFQQKCFDRIRKLKRDGVTVLFVSHDVTSVKLLCDRAILLHKGKICSIGSPSLVANDYLRINSGSDSDSQKNSAQPVGSASEEASVEYRYGDGTAEIFDAGLRSPVDKIKREAFLLGEPSEIYVRIRFFARLSNPVVGFYIKDKRGVEIYSGNTHYLGVSLGAKNSNDEVEVCFSQRLTIAPGEYSLSFGVSEYISGVSTPLDRRYEALKFSIISDRVIIGLVDLESKVDITKLHREFV